MFCRRFLSDEMDFCLIFQFGFYSFFWPSSAAVGRDGLHPKIFGLRTGCRKEAAKTVSFYGNWIAAAAAELNRGARPTGDIHYHYIP